MSQLDKLGLQQLHLDHKDLIKQYKTIAELLEHINNRDIKALIAEALPKEFKIKADSLPPIEIDGDLKAVVDGSRIEVTNLDELEQYFIGLQLAMVEAIASPTRLDLSDNAGVLPVALQEIEVILALLAQIADKEMTVNVEQGDVIIDWPRRPSEAIPVKLVDKDGKVFYNASFSASMGGGGGGDPTLGQGQTLQFASIDQSTQGTDELVAAAANAKIYVVSYVVVMTADGTLQFTGSDSMTGAMPIYARGGASVVGQPSSPVMATDTGEALSITTTGGAAKGHISYFVKS